MPRSWKGVDSSISEYDSYRQEVELRPGSTAKARFSLSVAVGAHTHRARLLQGEVPRMVRGEEARNVAMEED